MKQKSFLLIEKTYLIVLFSAISIAGTGKDVLAQLPPSGDVTSPRDQIDRIEPGETLPPLEDLIDTPQIPPDLQEGDPTVVFEVKEFKIEGNTAFSELEIQELLTEYLNTSVSFADLLQVETVITEKYRNAGYINSGAVVPVQNVENGVITVQVIEGTIEQLNVQVKGGRLSENYIGSRLKRGTKTPFNLNELQEALQLLQLNPLVENLNAELSVGSRRDRWLLDVEVNQANAFNPVIFANNSRTPSVGSFQRGIEINHDNFAGLADRLSLIYKNTDGSNDYNFDYNVPFNSLDGSFGVRYRYITSEIVEPPFDTLDIESRTDELEVTIRQPIILTATANSTQELALGLEFSRQANETELDGDPFPLSPGATDDGKTRINAVRFFQDWTRRTRQDVFAARSQFNFGLDIFDSTTSGSDEPDGEFFSWRGQAQWLKLISAESNINFLLRSDIQISNSEMVPLEQFSLGGIDTVRGYRQDSLLGDSGLLISAELRVPVVRWNNRQSSVALIPFTDFGTVWGEQELPNQDEETIASVGVGVQLSLSEILRARLDWGIPLVEVDDRDRTIQEDGIYFSVEVFPF
ncbi:MAG: ShlB/FhaC/HecB family hemolysin secretion/activation protein [Xenococcus sp. (in: cyanobacteria)]